MTRPAPVPAEDAVRAAFESFLVEDVILTLGNLRGSLLWLGEGSAIERICIDRLDRQLGLLEDRAHRMARLLRDEESAPEPANLCAAPPAGAVIPSCGEIEALILGGFAGRGEETPAAVFRSRRP